MSSKVSLGNVVDTAAAERMSMSTWWKRRKLPTQPITKRPSRLRWRRFVGRWSAEGTFAVQGVTITRALLRVIDSTAAATSSVTHATRSALNNCGRSARDCRTSPPARAGDAPAARLPHLWRIDEQYERQAQARRSHEAIACKQVMMLPDEGRVPKGIQIHLGGMVRVTQRPSAPPSIFHKGLEVLLPLWRHPPTLRFRGILGGTRPGSLSGFVRTKVSCGSNNLPLAVLLGNGIRPIADCDPNGTRTKMVHRWRDKWTTPEG